MHPASIPIPRRNGATTVGSCCVLLMITALAVPAYRISAEETTLHGPTVVHFSSLDEARMILGRSDRFIEALSPFDRQSRLETTREVTQEEFLRFAASHAQAWDEEQVRKLRRVVERLRARLDAYRLPLPPVVNLVQTSGREEGQAAYCRGNAILLPAGKLDDPEPALERLLNHELFHVLSSHNPRLRETLYGIIGFRPGRPLDWPESLRPRKITNPDAPLADAYLTLRVNDATLVATPVLFANAERFDPQQGGPFFKYLVFRLLVVQQAGDRWEAVMQNGEPQLLVPAETPDFGRQIGKNTRYILHPDEILADNFVHLVQQTPSLPSPEIVAQMKSVLSNASATNGGRQPPGANH